MQVFTGTWGLNGIGVVLDSVSCAPLFLVKPVVLGLLSWGFYHPTHNLSLRWMVMMGIPNFTLFIVFMSMNGFMHIITIMKLHFHHVHGWIIVRERERERERMGRAFYRVCQGNSNLSWKLVAKKPWVRWVGGRWAA